MTAPDCRRCDYQDRAERAERAERELRDTYRAALARVAELERERDAALIERDEAQHTFRCLEEDERYLAVVARAEMAERELGAISSQTVEGSVIAKMPRKSLERFAVWLHQERNQSTDVARDARAKTADLVTALTDALEWMEVRFGNADGTDWEDESAAAVADAVDAALEKAKEATNGSR